MTALPHTTVVVVSLADQRGVDASRLSFRAVGEADLLSLNNDEASLALNRLTEFIISGALLPPPSAPSTTEP